MKMTVSCYDMVTKFDLPFPSSEINDHENLGISAYVWPLGQSDNDVLVSLMENNIHMVTVHRMSSPLPGGVLPLDGPS